MPVQRENREVGSCLRGPVQVGDFAGGAAAGSGRGGLGMDGRNGQEGDPGGEDLQTVMGLSPVGGKRGKSRGFAQMRLLRLVPAG
jgi:hypothetical protein